jgi:hypothetical protein
MRTADCVFKTVALKNQGTMNMYKGKEERIKGTGKGIT